VTAAISADWSTRVAVGRSESATAQVPGGEVAADRCQGGV